MPARRLAWPSAAAFAVLLALAVAGCRTPTKRPDPPAEVANRNVRYGLPAPATADPLDRSRYLIDRPEYVLSYNDPDRVPNWVSWHLRAADVGDAPRSSFEADPLLPSEFRRVGASAYENSGFDRGHMCNSKDRTATPEQNAATFYMTNMVPQAPNNNQQGWEEFESYCRGLTRQGNELFIVCGPHGTGGEGKNGYRDQIGKSGEAIRVPAHVWKVVLVVPAGADPEKQGRTLAVWMPNDQTVTTDWKRHQVSVADVEGRTGYKFFPKVGKALARASAE